MSTAFLPTEAAGLAVVVSLALGIYNGEVNRKRLRQSMVEDSVQTAVVMHLVASVMTTSYSIAKANIWDASKVNVYFVAVLLVVLLMCTYIPAIPMFLVEYFYRLTLAL